MELGNVAIHWSTPSEMNKSITVKKKNRYKEQQDEAYAYVQLSSDELQTCHSKNLSQGQRRCSLG